MTVNETNTALASVITELNQNLKLKGSLGIHSSVTRRLRDLALSMSECPLVFYWGAYHQKTNLKHELAQIRYLREICYCLEKNLRIPVKMNIILTDSHASLNGVPKAISDDYFKNVKDAFPSSWTTYFLKDLDNTTHSKPIGNLQGYERIEKLLLMQASKLHKEEKKAIDLAKRYLIANIRESAVIQKKWPSGIFLHSGIPELSVILPSLPILYIYSGHHKAKQKPWFRK